ncbi:uncharacterized protein LOC125051420 [Pieris napi]|uniref:uncharacterized protein LOC125051420 n=1 Tax=Pieris napi TaxID=78633 RepID=UPI001FB8A498|nr:uncharacterized protein LOC125051420 [Pieris napi]
MWEEIAIGLNAHGDGAVKDCKAWNKYWNDYKSKLKKLAHLNRLSRDKTGGGKPVTKEISDLEQKFLSILGEDFGSGLPQIRVEPFIATQSLPDTNTDFTDSILAVSDWVISHTNCIEPQPSEITNHPPPLTSTLLPVPSTSTLLPQPSTSTLLPQPSTSTLLPQPSTSTLLPQPSTSTLTQPVSSHQRQQSTTGSQRPPRAETSHRRRATRNRQISAQAARQALIEEAQKQTKLKEEKLELWRRLVKDINEIKDILKAGNFKLKMLIHKKPLFNQKYIFIFSQ